MRSKTRSRRRNGFIEKLEQRLLCSTQSYNWQNADIGAGGFVDGIFYSATQQNVIYARTDIGGLYKSTNDGANWQELLDFVGNNTGTSGNNTQSQEIGVLSFAIDPENPSNLYADVGQYTGTNGDVLYSTNAGQSWTATPLSFYVGGNSNGRGDGEQIAVDPNDSSIVFLGTNSAGLWESTNAGHSFAQVSNFTSTPTSTSTTFVLFDPTSGTPGSPSKTIYVGIDSLSSGTNLYSTTNGGSSWSPITGTGTLPTALLPGHAVLSGGNMYLGYANGESPNTTLTSGGVYRYTPMTGVWASISPAATGGNFGYDAVAADLNNPNTIVVSSMDDYSGPDQIWRTTDANAATPTWTELYDYSTAQNFGFNGYDTTRNTSNAPWTAAFGDGISNWADTIAIDPFNSNQLMYGTGQGIWATNNLSNNGTNTQLTATNSWYFPDTGIEFTSVLKVSAAPSGVPLFSAMGDINGFAATTLTSSPAQGAIIPGAALGTMNYVEFATGNPNDDVIVGSSGTEDGAYSTNDGSTWTEFAAKPSGASSGTVAASSTGGASMTIVWAPSGKNPFYSTNDGTTWTASTVPSGTTTGGQIVADSVNASEFYYYSGGKLYISTNSGVTFTVADAAVSGGGNLASNPFTAGDLWLATSAGLFHSTNSGTSFSPVATGVVISASEVALGAPAPGQTYPAVYIYGRIGSFTGVYRSDDDGATWVQINDVNHQWGGLIQTIAADPTVFGRVYIGVNGRGIIVGNPTGNLPTAWIDTDINAPGNPGNATSSVTLSNGTIVNQWIVNGGGDGLTGSSATVSSLTDVTQSTGAVLATAVMSAPNFSLHIGDQVTISGATPAGYDGTFAVNSVINSTTFTYTAVPGLASATGTITASTNDQFNFVHVPINNNATFSAQITGMTNADGTSGTPEAGVMVRAATNDNDPFAAMVQTTAGQLIFEFRSTTGGPVSNATLSGVPVGSEYVEIVRSGSNLSGYYSSNGSAWTQLGPTVSIPAIPSTAPAGMVATSSFNSQLTSATFAHVASSMNAGPTVQTPAAAMPNPVTGTTANLSVLGTEGGTDAGLTYDWSATGPAPVLFSDNDDNSAKNDVATFAQAGSYVFTATITDAGGLSITSVVDVTVNQTAAAIAVTPPNVTIAAGTSEQFSASADDQFGNAIASPTFDWSVTGSGNSIDSTGDASFGSTPGQFTVTAAIGSINGSTTATTLAAPNLASFIINDGSAQRSVITSLTVTFSEPVTLSPGAITLDQLPPSSGGSSTPENFTLSNPSNDQETYVLTFSDPSDVGGSLPDGVYTVGVDAALVQDAAGTTLSGGNQSESFYRLFGDFDGDATVNLTDLLAILNAYGQNSSQSQYFLAADSNVDGTINLTDLLALLNNYGENEGPTVALNSIGSATAGSPLTITANSRAASSADVLSYQWSVLDENGDPFILPNGGITNTPSITFTPNNPGTWSVSVQATDTSLSLASLPSSATFNVSGVIATEALTRNTTISESAGANADGWLATSLGQWQLNQDGNVLQ